jgi:P27 family predicted phage terminase small subunit
LKNPPPPKGLSAEAAKRWKAIVAEYGIVDAGGLHVLSVGLEAFDRMRACQQTITEAGATFVDRFGQPRPHPLLSVERDSRAAYLAALKQLHLDLEPVRDMPGRPPGR